MKIIVAGASGLIGKELVSFLKERGHQVKTLIRAPQQKKSAEEVVWDPKKGTLDQLAIEGTEVFINLAGKNILDSRWSDSVKAEIKMSRIQATRTLVQAIQKMKELPTIFLNASAIGYYGDRGAEKLTEKSAKGDNFLTQVCQAWEEEALALQTVVRTVCLRFGIVLSAKGGALKKMLLPFRCGLGGKLGSGEQYVSWITLIDVLHSIEFVLQQPSLKGPINTVTPYPVTNKVFTKTLGKVLKRPTFMSLPAAILRLAVGQAADELLLASTLALPEKLLEAGYLFKYPQLEEALAHREQI